MSKPKIKKFALFYSKQGSIAINPINRKVSSSFGHSLETKQNPLITTQTIKRASYYKKRNQNSFGWAKIAVAVIVLLLSSFPLFPQKNADVVAVNSISIASAWGDANLNIWWPTNQANIQGTQPFKAEVSGQSVDSYQMYWQVDAGQLNAMYNSSADYPHKEAIVDLSGWTWKGNGPYTIGFLAKDSSGQKIAQKYETIYINGSPQTANQVSASVQDAVLTQIPKAANSVFTTTAAAAEPTPLSAASPVATPTLTPTPTPTPTPTSAPVPQHPLDVWWPTDGATVSDIVPFKTMLEQLPVTDYSMYWQVDGGTLHSMDNNSQDYPHKEIAVNVDTWNGKGSGPYTVTFIAKNTSGQVVGTSIVHLNISHSVAVEPAPVSVPTPTPAPQQAAIQPVLPPPVIPAPSGTSNSNNSAFSGNSVFSGATLYVNPYSDAKKQANEWRSSRPSDAAQLDKVASGAETKWFGSWNSNVQSDVNNDVTAIAKTGALPVLVAYNIPNRDCGGWSSGGTGSPEAYRQWIRSFANGIGARKAAVILEPDSTALVSCLSSSDLQTRYSLLKDAVSVLKNNGQTVYIDAGHPGWITAGDIAARLQQAGIDQADGFALNIANFNTSQENINYGQAISSLVGGKHFVIDTGRNGNGPTQDAQWCNPSGRALGYKPTTNTGNSLVDAFLWVKGPGGSDGYCNGGPAAGSFWPDSALHLAQLASW